MNILIVLYFCNANVVNSNIDNICPIQSQLLYIYLTKCIVRVPKDTKCVLSHECNPKGKMRILVGSVFLKNKKNRNHDMGNSHFFQNASQMPIFFPYSD